MSSADALEDTALVDANRPHTVILNSPIDEFDLQDPRGYAHGGGQSHRLQKSVTIENVGSTPLVNPELILNGLDWSAAPPPAGPHPAVADGQWVRRAFQFWIDHRLHASSASKLARSPINMFRWWGYTLCDEDTRSLAATFHAAGIPARHVPLNGHVAAEYFFDQKWNVLDGDQNIFYLALDNRQLASAEEIRRDPFIAIRTKPFGRHTVFSVNHARANAALFEYLTPAEPKLIKPSKRPAPSPVQETLFPGEKLIFHFERPPDIPVGSTDLSAWPGIRERALATSEWVLSPGARGASPPQLVFSSSLPILSATNHTTHQSAAAPKGEPALAIAVPLRAVDDAVSILCQRSRVSLPFLKKGSNSLLLRAVGAGRARITFALHAAEGEQPPPIRVKAPAEFMDEDPAFDLETPAAADQIWWQIADGARFLTTLPNFDQVQKPAPRVAIDRISATFFGDGDLRFFRAKARVNGIWSAWSETTAFRLGKPTPVSDLTVAILADGQLEIRWAAQEAEEFLVFGSNRLDFLPEIYASEEIIAMRHFQPTQTRPNLNLLASTRENIARFKPTTRFLRVIARRGRAYSTPSRLLETPPFGIANLAPATVLQVRAERIPRAGPPNGYEDEYLASESELPAAR